MIGINVDNLDKLIKINNLNSSSLEDNVSNLLGNLNELNDVYAGKDLNFTFSPLVEQSSNIKRLPRIIKSYSDVLSAVKISYQRQNANFRDLISHANTQIGGRR